jgi:hypothetical protein
MGSAALFISGAIFFLASWTNPSKHTSDLVFPLLLAIACFVGALLWELM